MKKILGMALAGILAAAPGASAQQVLCGTVTEGFVCVLAEFTLTNSNTTLNMFAFNGITPETQNVASSITGVVVNLPSQFVGTPPNSVTVGFRNGMDPVSDVSSNWAFQTQILQGTTLTADVGSQSVGNQGFTTCGGPASGGGASTRWATCDRPTLGAFGTGWDYMVFSWTFNSQIDPGLLNGIGWGFRGQSIGPNGGSIKCITDDFATGGNQNVLCDVDNFGDPSEIVPEPATMTLLATGLVGLAAARRRRKNIV